MAGRECKGVNEEERGAASQADEAYHLLALESQFCSGAIALTKGYPAHTYSVWNIDSFFPKLLQPFDENTGRAQDQITVRYVLRFDIGVGDEIQAVEYPGDG